MTPREAILHRVRSTLGRAHGQAPGEVPPARIQIPEVPLDERIEQFASALEKLNGKAIRAGSPGEARDYAARLLEGRRGIASNAPFLRECGITQIPGVTSGLTNREQLREACANFEVGITSADYALAGTGTLVMFSSASEARMISLLPPCHLAVVPAVRLLTGLDELLQLASIPSDRSSSMVLITGPSRTADIEQILVRGVHGPGEIHVILV